jgi:hypothetical protein
VPVVPAGPVAPGGAPVIPGGVLPLPPADPDPVQPTPVEPPPAALPAPPTGLAAARDNLSGTLIIDVDWTPPANSPVPVTGYQVVTANTPLAAGTTTTVETTHRDLRNYCAPDVTFTVRSVAADGSTSLPVTTTPAGRRPDCTQPTSVTSAVAEADGSVTVTVDCETPGRGPWETGQIQVLFDGDQRNPELQACSRGDALHDFHTFSITGLAPGTTYSVTSRTTSTTGPKTSDPVQVTTNP